jgi:hypothetical protein
MAPGCVYAVMVRIRISFGARVIGDVSLQHIIAIKRPLYSTECRGDAEGNFSGRNAIRALGGLPRGLMSAKSVSWIAVEI